MKRLLLVCLLMFGLLASSHFALADDPYSYDGWSFSVASQASAPIGLDFNGTYFYVLDSTTDDIFLYYSNGTYTGISYDLSSQTNSARGVSFNNTFFWVSSYDYIYKYYANGTYTGESNAGTDILNLYFNNTFIHYIYSVAGIDQVRRIYDNYTFVDAFSVASQDGTPYGIHLDNTYIYVLGKSTDKVYRYNFGGTYSNWNFSTGSETSDPSGLTGNGSYFWVVGYDNDRVYRYAPTATTESDSVDNCGVNTKVIMNATIFDEINVSLSRTARLEIKFDVDSINGVSSTEEFAFDSAEASYHEICLNDTIYSLVSDVEIAYYDTAENFAYRNYYLDSYNFTNTSILNQSLYLLNASKSTTFHLNIINEDLNYLSGAYVLTQRFYISDNVWRTVEISKTDDNGETITHLETEEPYYRYIVLFNGDVVYTGEPRKAYCTVLPCSTEIQVLTGEAVVDPFERYGEDIQVSLTFNVSGTNFVVFDYVDTSLATNYGRLHVYQVGLIDDTTICDVQASGASGSAVCNVTAYVGQNITIIADAYISRSPELHYGQLVVNLQERWRMFGNEGVIWAVLLIMALSMAFLWNPIAFLVMLVASVAVVSLIGMVALPFATIGAIIAIVAIIIIGMVRQ